MGTSYTGDSMTTMSEGEAKKMFNRDFEALTEKVLRLKESIGGRNGAREISMVYTKLQEAAMWMKEAQRMS